MKFLLATVANNLHVQNMALALHEADSLGGYHSGVLDNYRHDWSREFRRLIGNALPSLDGRLSRRRVTLLPDELIYSDRTWNGVLTAAQILGMSETIRDLVWEWSEHRFDASCSHRIKNPAYDAYFGLEYGALETARIARELGKPVVIGFLSPHHEVLNQWVYPEYSRYPELVTPYIQRLIKRTPKRTARKNQEANLADAIVTASRFTTDSLVRYAGVDSRKIVTVPLGGPPAIPRATLPDSPEVGVKFIFAGSVAVHKGAHHLLQAWRLLQAGNNTTLDLFGSIALPPWQLEGLGPTVRVHGRVSPAELDIAYGRSSVLVFPTLFDGFGMVVQEALAHGVPVITTTNAGAADLIENGKNGFLIPPGDVEALAEAMRWCVSHPELVWKMRLAALETAEAWTWKDFRASFRAQLAAILGIEYRSSPVAAMTS